MNRYRKGASQRNLSLFCGEPRAWCVGLLLLSACSTVPDEPSSFIISDRVLHSEKPMGVVVDAWNSSLGLPCERIKTPSGSVIACAQSGSYYIFPDRTE